MNSETKVHFDQFDIDQRLADLGLAREPFVRARQKILLRLEHAVQIIRPHFQGPQDGPKLIAPFEKG